jgi:outer membrane protein OmpA-like peptidoglycan-associated protein
LVPTAYNWQAEIAQFASDGFGLGDIGVGAKVIAIKLKRDLFNLGVRASLILPTGRADSWMSETGVRFAPGLLACVNVGPVRFGTDLGLMTRPALETTEDFTLSSEFQWGNGLRVALPDATRTAFTAQTMSRNGFSNFFRGGAENSLEALGGIQVLPIENVVVDVAAGRGLTEGYGTTDLRILAAISIQHVPKEPPPPLVIEEPPPPPPPPPPIPDEPPPEEPPEWEEGELARRTVDRIEIREMLQFVVDTNIMKDFSRPTLQAVGDIINGDAQIGHLVIEGHASQEGSFDHNYKLAESRARRVWEELIQVGVHPERVSYRGMGEVVTKAGFEGEDEESLQENRRVEFKIVHQYTNIEDMPDYDTAIRLPWNGVSSVAFNPPKPEPVVEEEPEPRVDEFGLPIGPDVEEEFEMDVPEEASTEPMEETGDTGAEEEPAVEEAPVEAPAEEPPAEELPAEEPPAEEPPADEPPAEEAPAEEPAPEAPAEEPPAEPAPDEGGELP